MVATLNIEHLLVECIQKSELAYNYKLRELVVSSWVVCRPSCNENSICQLVVVTGLHEPETVIRSDIYSNLNYLGHTGTFSIVNSE